MVHKAMILAAGEGSRLRPLTFDRPKPMLPIGDRPLLQHTLSWLHHYGITEIAINLHYLPQKVIDCLGDGRPWGVSIRYSIEEQILGTAGGVKRMAGFLDETFVLVYGDVLTDLDLQALLAWHDAQDAGPHLTMSLYRVPNPWECGIVGLDERGRVTRFVEKPPRDRVFSDWANTGILVVDPQILAYIPEGCFADWGQDVLPRLLATGIPIYGWPIPAESYLLDIGAPEKYAAAQNSWPTPAARKYLASGPESCTSGEGAS
jgi:NDP-sugar pyrophosphorylase family protein